MISGEEKKVICDSDNVAEIMKAVLAAENDNHKGREHIWVIET